MAPDASPPVEADEVIVTTTATSSPTNPFETATTAEDDANDDDRSVHSAASLALREDFIRLTTTPSVTDDQEEEEEEEDPANNNSNLKPSLAQASTTPKLLWILIPLLCLVAHALFVMGQTLPMWKLSLAAENISVWANATTSKSQWAYTALGLPYESHWELHHNQNRTVETFTYGFAVRELWQAKGMGGVAVPRLAAGLLVLASGIWPHGKLVLLQYAWWSQGRIAQAPAQRTRALGWLALLGKWSLADVLVVCVMVGVLNLEWSLDPPTMKEGIENHLQTLLRIAPLVWKDHDICTHILHFSTKDCGSKKLSYTEQVKCKACKSFVREAFDKPDFVQKHGKPVLEGVATNGGGQVRLSVVGLNGIYYFCAAVSLSILLSVVVEWYNHKYVAAHYRQAPPSHASRRRGQRDRHALSLHEESDEERANSTISDISEPLLGDTDDEDGGFQALEIMEDDQSVLSYVIHRTTSSPTYQCFQCDHLVPIGAVAFVYLAIYLPSMERHVGGAIPKLMRDILGVELDKTYSLQTLKETCGAAGGMDLFLQATFGLFIVVGPLLRAILVFIVAMSKSSGSNTQRIRSLLVSFSNFLAAFCAWEVFLIGLVMVGLIMPSATSTILDKPACRELSGDGTSCLQVDFLRVPSAFACLVTGFLLVGGLAIHVSMEDQNERFLLENSRFGRAAPSDDQYYVEVASGDADENAAETPDDEVVPDDPRRRGSNEDAAVATMIEEEAV